MIGAVEKYLLRRIREQGAIHLTLIDPEKVTAAFASRLAKQVEKCKTTAIMVGGSTSTSTAHLDSVVKAIKRTIDIPI
ncbi:MAG: geranylgeranylglyceryl/heptaprenylglyceryl phosphate synthase, partial [Candidatus Bathyarchaeota archaeon]